MCLKTKLSFKMIGFIVAIGLAASANAQNRFTPIDGGAIGGHGTYGEGSVTVHHNLLAAERQELENMMASMRSDLTAHINAVESALNGDIEAVERWAADIEKQAKAAKARADDAHARLDLLASRLSEAERKILANKIAAANAQSSADHAENLANNAQTSANNAQNTANKAVNDAYNAHVRANQAYSEAVSARSRADSAYSLAKSSGGGGCPGRWSGGNASSMSYTCVNTGYNGSGGGGR